MKPKAQKKIVGVVTLEESLARWEHIKANWKYRKMKCVKPKRKIKRRKLYHWVCKKLKVDKGMLIKL